MVLTKSIMLRLGSLAPDFSLLNPVSGKTVALNDLPRSPALLVAFICNHCPFVIHIADHFSEFASRWAREGLSVVAINSNDAVAYPADSPERMVEEVTRRKYSFPYLFDESQEIAKAYGAACTPDFFLYDADRRLAYRGQYDSTRPSLTDGITGADLEHALRCVFAKEAVPEPHRPSMGCNIKWRAGNEPPWFG